MDTKESAVENGDVDVATSVNGSKKRKGEERTPRTPKKRKTDQGVEGGSSKVEEEKDESKVRISAFSDILDSNIIHVF